MVADKEVTKAELPPFTFTFTFEDQIEGQIYFYGSTEVVTDKEVTKAEFSGKRWHDVGAICHQLILETVPEHAMSFGRLKLTEISEVDWIFCLADWKTESNGHYDVAEHSSIEMTRMKKNPL